jgi:predicted RNA-binding protein with PIN domain
VTTEVPPVPEALLAPLLDVAALVLRSLPALEIPPSLRAVAGFDARGLARGPARRQLLRALGEHDDYRRLVVERFLERPDARAVLDAWVPSDALRIVRDSMEPSALAALASVLYAARPPAWAFALGAVCEAGANEAQRRATAREAGTRASDRAAAIDARRRAEATLAESQRTIHHLEQERRDERRARRERDESMEEARAEWARDRGELEAALARARASEAREQARADREAERVAVLARELDAISAAVPPPPVDVAAVRAAADDAHRLADRLEALADDVATATVGSPATRSTSPGVPDAVADAEPAAAPPPGPRPRTARPRRNRPPSPPGLVVDTPAGLDAMLRTRGLLLVVDGYNVTKTAWPTAVPEEQRTRLLAALAELHLRLRCDVVVAFDGADVRGVPQPRRPGVRVVYSAGDEEADDVVVREAAALPRTVPVVVASSDGGLRRRAEAEGALTVGSGTLLAVLRR